MEQLNEIKKKTDECSKANTLEQAKGFMEGVIYMLELEAKEIQALKNKYINKQ